MLPSKTAIKPTSNYATPHKLEFKCKIMEGYKISMTLFMEGNKKSCKNMYPWHSSAPAFLIFLSQDFNISFHNPFQSI